MKNTMLHQKSHIQKVKTNLLILPKLNSKLYISLQLLPKNLKSQFLTEFLTMKNLLALSIGLPKVLFNMLKIKDNVDLAGLSPLPQLLNLLNGSQPES